MTEPTEAPGSTDDLAMVEPTAELKRAFLAMLRDFERHGEPFRVRASDLAPWFDAYLEQLRAWAGGDGLAPGLVAQSTWWLVRDGREVLGSATLRSHLTPALEIEGGHIGYSIKPSVRRRGYGTAQLALMLRVARAHGHERVLVTCDADNVASRKIIEANGGASDGEAVSPRTGKLVLRFWCATPES